MRSQTTLMASTLSLLQAQSSLFSSVIGLQPACFCLQTACNRLDKNKPVAGLLQHLFFSIANMFSVLKREERFWEQKLFKNSVFLLQTRSKIFQTESFKRRISNAVFDDTKILSRKSKFSSDLVKNTTHSRFQSFLISRHLFSHGLLINVWG